MTSALRRFLLVGPPLALAVALWWHPAGGEDVYAGVRDDVDAWLFVHTAFLLATPLLGIAVFVLLRGLEGGAALVSRVALVFFLVFYTAYESNVGICTAVLVDYANGLPAAEQAVVAGAIQARRPQSSSTRNTGWVAASVTNASTGASAGASK